jgi:hypothetical protein
VADNLVDKVVVADNNLVELEGRVVVVVVRKVALERIAVRKAVEESRVELQEVVRSQQEHQAGLGMAVRRRVLVAQNNLAPLVHHMKKEAVQDWIDKQASLWVATIQACQVVEEKRNWEANSGHLTDF